MEPRNRTFLGREAFWCVVQAVLFRSVGLTVLSSRGRSVDGEWVTTGWGYRKGHAKDMASYLWLVENYYRVRPPLLPLYV